MDDKNWQQWRNVFSDDMVLDVDMTVADNEGKIVKSPTIRGADNVVAAISTLLKNMKTVHHGHMFEVELTSSTTASGIWAMEDIVESKNGKLHGYGHYHENYIKKEDKWLICYSHLTRLRLDIKGDFETDAAATNFT